MVLTFEDYHKLTVIQRAKVKRADLQQLLGEHINADNANSMHGIICSELKRIPLTFSSVAYPMYWMSRVTMSMMQRYRKPHLEIC